MLMAAQDRLVSTRRIHTFQDAFSSVNGDAPKRKKKVDDQHGSREDSDEDESRSNSETSSDDQDPLPVHFPVARLKRPRDPEAAPRRNSEQRNTKTQHLEVLNAILHKSVLNADFIRAGRAFSMLIRSELQGKPIDLRNNGLWGIASEILLRRNGGMPMDDEGATNSGDASHRSKNRFPYSEQGLKDARRLFERLALQYPHKRYRPGSVDETHFWPVIYGLEIFQLQAKLDRAKQQAGLRSPSPRTEMDDDEEGDVIMTDSMDQTAKAAIAGYLHDIERLIDEIEDRIMAPPFDRDSRLLKLQGDLCFWMADLSPQEQSGWRRNAEDAHAKAKLYANRKQI